MALYHTYRPQQFADVLGQPHVVSVLRSAIVHDRVGHAYLFSGPRGVGKTSIARILAKAINCETNAKRKTQNAKPNEEPKTTPPCNRCAACESITDGSALDVIEIDAASNRGIDEIRELRDRVRFAPTTLAKKVYIIDEVHMLTKEAFNALLKTLEEPPGHVVFVLATTELQKIPETIFSRCQHLQFRRAAPDALATHLAAIAAQEGRTLEPDALELLVLRAEGSYRDALSAFEQVLVAADSPLVTANLVRTLFGLPAEQRSLDVLAAIAVGDRARILEVLSQLSAEGVSFESFVTELIRVVRLLLLLATLGTDRVSGGSAALRTAAPALLQALPDAALVELLQELAHVTGQMRTSPIPALPFEVTLLAQAGKRAPDDRAAKPPAAVKHNPEPIAVEQRVVTPDAAATTVEDQEPAGEVLSASENGHAPSVAAPVLMGSALEQPLTAEFGFEQWRTIRQSLARQDASLAMLIAELELPQLVERTLTLEVPYKFHADRLLSSKPRALLTAAVSAALGQSIAVTCAVNPKLRTRPAPALLHADTVIDDPVSALSEL